jgi:hypothetical protein
VSGESGGAGLHGRGGRRLLHDCAVIGRVVTADRPPAAERVELELGDRLTALLRSALTGDQARRHSWQETVGATWSAPLREVRPTGGRIVVLHPELPTAVSLGVGRNRKQRMVSPVGAREARERKAALNERLLAGQTPAAESDGRVELACECGDETCPSRIVLTAEEYAFLRKVPGYYAVSADHVGFDDHVIVGDAGRFAIVE